MDTLTLIIVVFASIAINLLILYFVISAAVANGVKKSQKILINLVYRMAEQQKVPEDALLNIKKLITDL